MDQYLTSSGSASLPWALSTNIMECTLPLGKDSSFPERHPPSRAKLSPSAWLSWSLVCLLWSSTGCWRSQGWTHWSGAMVPELGWGLLSTPHLSGWRKWGRVGRWVNTWRPAVHGGPSVCSRFFLEPFLCLSLKVSLQKVIITLRVWKHKKQRWRGTIGATAPSKAAAFLPQGTTTEGTLAM